MDGILPLWKPKGFTSHDCVMIIRRLLKTKKVGHTGTLDPEVEGVLLICIGQATKIVPYLTDTKKTYEAEVMLGKTTETEDAYGKTIEEVEVTNPPTEEDIENMLQSFTGTITQVPPMYSAVKVNGRKLYEYARENIPVERPKRQVTIYEITRLPQVIQKHDSFRVQVVCSKGTYIRTLCVDMGKTLGYPAHMSDLTRTQTGPFTKKNTVTFDMIETAVENNTQKQLLEPIMKGLNHLDRLNVDEDTKKRILYGQKLAKPKEIVKQNPFVVLCDQELLAIYQIHPEKPDLIKPVRVFQG
ncbi:tRNA pseudouridine55 synthase [Virgibacillus halotolerans]|uniref:tRNA pseudouridine(55) synthase TruB n=1 Tax=Virgibacillus halotolerans TaxID=1071053 RepID=UPI001960A14C|nr:tRNA pseudouridine(55) synthase TruB [Virgibacillus halotolerans]MBM7598554.1 tRNA pseudouridine55 synthase [Virgibacillus halotolerans]